MNANRYLKSRLGVTIEKMKIAYLAGKNIFFLVTPDIQLVNQLVLHADSFLPFINKNEKKEEGISVKKDSCSVKFVDTKIFIENGETTEICDHPLFYVYWMDSDEDKLNLPDTHKIHGLPKESLRNYVTLRESLKNESIQRNNILNSVIVIIVDSPVSIPAFIEPYSEMIMVPYMDKEEFNESVSKIIKELDNVSLVKSSDGQELLPDSKYLGKLYDFMRNMNSVQIEAILKKNKVVLGNIYFDSSQNDKMEKLMKNIRSETQNIISNSAALTIVTPSDKKPAGMDGIVEWLESNKFFITNLGRYKKEFITPPKGILVSGIPGTGKSMMAKYIAYELNLNLVKFDLGDVLGGYVGDSEKNMNKALMLIEALSPCVLWVDEMEKAFAGSNSNNTNNDVTKRVLGKFLTWMQERESRGVSCFVFATANDIGKMPPEMFRSGRFDEKFYTFMPSSDDCRKIFREYLKGQCEDYRPQNQFVAKEMFDTEELEKWFIEYLERKDTKQLFIGSDITKMVDTAKKYYLKEQVILSEKKYH